MTNPASPHENGVAEQAHYRLKSAIAQSKFRLEFNSAQS
jgi:hypothetical protein